MPRLSMTVPHQLGQEEAIRRIRQKATAVHATYANQVSDLQQQWNDHVYSFSLSTMGMPIKGAVTVEEAQIKMDAEVPIVALIFKAMIERQVREELDGLLKYDVATG